MKLYRIHGYGSMAQFGCVYGLLFFCVEKFLVYLFVSCEITMYECMMIMIWGMDIHILFSDFILCRALTLGDERQLDLRCELRWDS